MWRRTRAPKDTFLTQAEDLGLFRSSVLFLAAALLVGYPAWCHLGLLALDKTGSLEES